MKKMMDEVVFENLGRDGKSLTLVKHIKDEQNKRKMKNCENDALIKSRPVSPRKLLHTRSGPFDQKMPWKYHSAPIRHMVTPMNPIYIILNKLLK